MGESSHPVSRDYPESESPQILLTIPESLRGQFTGSAFLERMHPKRPLWTTACQHPQGGARRTRSRNLQVLGIWRTTEISGPTL